MPDDDDQFLPPDGEPEIFDVADFEEDDDGEGATDDDAAEPMFSIHRFTDRVWSYERKMKRTYMRAANALDMATPDLATDLAKHLCILAVCVTRGIDWPLAGAGTDAGVREAAKGVTPDRLKGHAASILNRIADEIHAATCAGEALVVFDLLQRELPARLDNLPIPEVCRTLTREVWELYGSIPGYTERSNRRDGK